MSRTTVFGGEHSRQTAVYYEEKPSVAISGGSNHRMTGLVGEVNEQTKKERDLQYPPVRTKQVQSISYLLYGKRRNSLR